MIIILIQIFILIYSIIAHEIAHGYVAYLLGDPTAKNEGRLTLNPLPHIDFIGSILLPAIFIVSGSGLIFGWAKPVPIDNRYFKNFSKDILITALSGPLCNITIAIIFSLLLKLSTIIGLANISLINFVLIMTIQINLVLAIFNLIPIPPLDGSHILEHFLPYRARIQYEQIAPYGILIIFLLAYLGILSWFLNLFLMPIYRLLL